MKKNRSKAIAMLLLLAACATEACAQSAIYACGHIRRTRPAAINFLRNSGYTTVILFNVDVAPDGTLITDYNWDKQEAAEAGGIICQDGEYVFGKYQPHYVADIKNLLVPPTSVNRIEICIGGWGNGAYGKIRDLIKKHGTGEETVLYRNFKALKEAIPEIVAVNNDQEQDYDLETAVAFHRMMAEIGYKTTIAPYMNRDYWRDLVARLNETPGTCEIVYLQVYGGGAGNKPSEWKVFGDVPMHVGFDCEANGNRGEMERKFTQWRDDDGVVGGFLWNYNGSQRNINEWASAVNRIFKPRSTDNGVAVFYQDKDFGGYAVALPEGGFTQAEMALYGLKANDVTSFKVDEGYEVTLYKGANFNGESLKRDAGEVAFINDIAGGWNDRVCSLKIERAGNTLAGMPGGSAGLEWSVAGGVLTVTGELAGTVSLFAATGEEVFSVPVQGAGCAKLEISSLSPGMYVLKSGNCTAKMLKH